MIVQPVTRDEANAVILRWHRHHNPVRSHRFAISAHDGEAMVGVSIVGNPEARALQNGTTFELLRLCTNGHPNAASFLLGASWRVCKEMGVTRLVSYLRVDEQGVSYKAAGWRAVARVKGRSWEGRRKTGYLPGFYEPPTEIVNRMRWEKP